MRMPRPSEDDKSYFRSLLPGDPDVDVKVMFGNLGAFANGHMFASLLGPDVGLRLDEPARSELAAVDGAGGFGPGPKPMRGYVSLPGAWRATPDRAEPWVRAALEQARALAPKSPKPRKTVI
jgi:TfoX/Sxy family transcriptional regulator of competence genes